MKNAVVISHAPKINYMHNYTVLPYYYGTDRYFQRPDVKAIRETVFKNLDDLDGAVGWKEKFKGRKVLLKPNNVLVYHDMGFELREIPESTDPRVLEAIIDCLSQQDCDITIIESPGKPAPAWTQFIEQRLDQVCKRYNCKMVALEEQPIDHYYLPKAQVMRDVYIPRIVSEIVKGEALYVSCPKMKTNLYTKVTLGFKNAMGILPANVRFRNHSWQIDKKLVDMLYLFQPDLTIVDGIIGGEGNTPGPVDPVKVGMIVSGTNGIEVDRVVTQIMGFDPNEIPLMKEAEEQGFGDKNVEIIGEQKIVPFRPADCSMLSERFKRNWSNVHLYVGHTGSRAPEITDLSLVTPEDVKLQEKVCTGGCLATVCYLLELNNKLQHKGDLSRFRLGIVIGNGCEVGGTKYWFDENGRAYDVSGLKAERKKRKYRHMIGIGSCTSAAFEACDIKGGKCCNVSEITNMMMLAVPNPIFGWRDEKLVNIFAGMVHYKLKHLGIRLKGEREDIKFDAVDDRVFEIPDEWKDSDEDWIYVPHKR